MPKVFLIEWSASHLKDVALELQKNGCEILYWTGDVFYKNEFPNTLFHSSYDVVKAIPAEGVETKNFSPIGKDMIEKFYECESETLSMMNRIDYENESLHKKKELYYSLLKYWSNILEQKKPDAIIFSTTPHLVYDFMLYNTAKHLGIKTIFFIPTRIPDRLLLLNDIKEGSKKLLQELDKNVENKLEDLSEDMREYYKSQTEKNGTPRFPLYTHAELYKNPIKVLYAPPVKKIIDSIKDATIVDKGEAYLKRVFLTKSRLLTMGNNYVGLEYQKKLWEWEQLKKEFEKEYRALEINPDLNKKFIYAPLQFQPERSTSPEGGVFVDQFLMFDILSKAIPDDWVIYAKEHLSQWTKGGTHAHQGRYKGYYKKLASYKNVYLAKPEISSNILIDNCQATSTVAGTGSWEAVLNGKPSLTFGYASYKDCSEIFKVYDLDSCKEAIEKISGGWLPDKQKVLNYLGAFDRASVKARIEQGVEKTPVASMEENNKAILIAILEELNI